MRIGPVVQGITTGSAMAQAVRVGQGIFCYRWQQALSEGCACWPDQCGRLFAVHDREVPPELWVRPNRGVGSTRRNFFFNALSPIVWREGGRKMSTAQEIVEKLQEALEKQDFAGARSLLQDNLTAQGPIESFHTADSYIEATKRLAAIVERIDVKKIFADGNDVCLLYDMVTNTPAGTILIAEWYQVTGNKISSLRAVYDSLPFARMVG